MSDILKVSTPLSGYESTSKTNPISSNDKNITNVTDINKVTRNDSKSENADLQEDKPLSYQNSNFENFLKTLKKTASGTELISKLMFFKMGNLVNSGIKENFAEEISQFLEMLKLSEGDLLAFLKTQANSASKFDGDFFDLLRTALSESSSNDFNLALLDLLKKYNDLASNKHILNLILIDIENISKNLPLSFSKSLTELVKLLDQNAGAGDISKNLDVLKKEIIPFLSGYIKNTNDFGAVRNLISSLALNISRYENGDRNSFADALKSFMEHDKIKGKLAGVDINELINSLLKIDTLKAEENKFNEKLIGLLEKGIEGEAGYENIEVFKGILSSLLINESVYIPLLHVMLPLNINGSLMFSEIWVDPEAERDNDEQNEGKKIKALIKFDIKDIGFFDLIISNCNKKIDLKIFCPEKVIRWDKEIKTELKQILEKNGFEASSIAVEKSSLPVNLSEVFRKIYERKNTVNVKI